jgi:hypothetical protein
MKTLIAVTFLLFAFPTFARCANNEEMSLSIQMTTGERGRDSSSTTKTIVILNGTLDYHVTYGGRNRGRLPEKRSKFNLEDADEKRLIELIKSGNLLVTDSIERQAERTGTTFYFALRLSPEINGRSGLINIKGPRKTTDIKELKLYKDSVVLIEAVFEIIHRTDNEFVYEPLVN